MVLIEPESGMDSNYVILDSDYEFWVNIKNEPFQFFYGWIVVFANKKASIIYQYDMVLY